MVDVPKDSLWNRPVSRGTLIGRDLASRTLIEIRRPQGTLFDRLMALKTQDVSRRTVIKAGGIFAGLVGVGAVARAIGADKLLNLFAQNNKTTPPENFPSSPQSRGDKVAKPAQVANSDRLLIQPNQVKSLYSSEFSSRLPEEDRRFLAMYQNAVKHYLEKVFSQSQGENLTKAADLIGEQVLYLSRREGSSSDFQRALDPRWEKIIAKACDLVDYSPEGFPTTILEGIAFTESTFDSTVVNSVTGATGLFQVKPDAAHDVIRRIVMTIDSISSQKQKSPSDSLKLKKLQNELAGIKYQTVKSKDNPDYYKVDLSDLQTNTIIAIEYLDYLYSLFQDRSLAVWAYHLGLGNMAQAIGAHRGKSLDHMDEIVTNLGKFETAKTSREEFDKMLTPDLPNQTINFSTLLSNPAVKERLEKKGAWNDDTQYYVARCVAARALIAGLKAA